MLTELELSFKFRKYFLHRMRTVDLVNILDFNTDSKNIKYPYFCIQPVYMSH